MTKNVIVAICTLNRPKMLQNCLESIADLEPVEGAFISAVVVENDSKERSRHVVERVAAETGLKITYTLETKAGIPFARNLALNACLENKADWIALIDDDSIARPDWLRKLYKACKDYKADVANGPVHQIFEKQPPRWSELRDLRMNKKLAERLTGEELQYIPTNNVLMASRIVQQDGLGLAFEEKLVSGAEDLDFFLRANKAGAMLIWVADAFVDETVPASRVTNYRLLSRIAAHSCGDAHMEILRKIDPPTAFNLFLSVIRNALRGFEMTLRGTLFLLFRRQKAELIFWSGIVKFTKAYGTLKALFGRSHGYYRKTDGS